MLETEYTVQNSEEVSSLLFFFFLDDFYLVIKRVEFNLANIGSNFIKYVL